MSNEWLPVEKFYPSCIPRPSDDSLHVTSLPYLHPFALYNGRPIATKENDC